LPRNQSEPHILLQTADTNWPNEESATTASATLYFGHPPKAVAAGIVEGIFSKYSDYGE